MTSSCRLLQSVCLVLQENVVLLRQEKEQLVNKLEECRGNERQAFYSLIASYESAYQSRQPMMAVNIDDAPNFEDMDVRLCTAFCPTDH